MLVNSAGENSPPDMKKAENSKPKCSNMGWQCRKWSGSNPSWRKAAVHVRPSNCLGVSAKIAVKGQ